MAIIAALSAGNPAIEPSRALLNDMLGADLYPPAKAADIVGDQGALLLAAREGTEVLGAAVCRLLCADDADYYHAFGATALELFTHHRVGSLEALAVKPTRQRRGLGTELTRAQMRWLADQGCDVAVAVSWIPAGRSTSGPMYERLEFVGTAPIDDFYLEESIADGWTCPQCQGPCHCAGALFYARLEIGR